MLWDATKGAIDSAPRTVPVLLAKAMPRVSETHQRNMPIKQSSRPHVAQVFQVFQVTPLDPPQQKSITLRRDVCINIAMLKKESDLIKAL